MDWKAIIAMVIQFAPMIVECIQKPNDQEARTKLRKFAERFTKMAAKNEDHIAFGLGSSLVCMTYQDEATFQKSCQQMSAAVDYGMAMLPPPTPVDPSPYIDPQ